MTDDLEAIRARARLLEGAAFLAPADRRVLLARLDAATKERDEAQMEYADCWPEGDRLRAALAAAEGRERALRTLLADVAGLTREDDDSRPLFDELPNELGDRIRATLAEPTDDYGTVIGRYGLGIAAGEPVAEPTPESGP